ncbi:MAG TPA: ABC transporter ATP-binding protein, partial [Beijerinckiaceae bacterium]|nr:ABC transporter ATP-binding protein [Beijerinckiaceae bacterium]
DESFSALDEMTAQRLRDEFAALVRENGKTAIFITHSVEEALQIGDRLVVLERPARIALDMKIAKDATREERDATRTRIREILAL